MSEKKLDLIIEKLDNHEARFNTLESLLTQQGEMVTQLLKIVGATNAKVSNLEKSVDELKVGQARHEELLTQFAASQERQIRLIEQLSSRSVKQDKDIENLKWKQLETQTDIGSTVDALSAKFIELEAEIKALKTDKDKEAS
jgi:glycine cleavage system regulatory protein